MMPRPRRGSPGLPWPGAPTRKSGGLERSPWEPVQAYFRRILGRAPGVWLVRRMINTIGERSTVAFLAGLLMVAGVPGPAATSAAWAFVWFVKESR